MNIKQRLYVDAQAACGLHVGDWVRVVDPEMNFGESWGTIYIWSGTKEEMIGKVVQITNICEDGIQTNNDLVFPYFALEKASYEEAQEASGLKVGDWVKIIRKAEDGENGWENNWSYKMNKNLDKIGVIKDINGYRGIEVFISDGENRSCDKSYYYPFFILEKVPAQEQKPDEKPEPEKKEHVFKPFDKVLVRNKNTTCWRPDIFLYIHKEMILDDEYACAGGKWEQCIPYEGNEHLVGTADMPVKK